MGLARLAERLGANPFLVLGIEPEAAPMEAERRARALIAMMELGLGEARTYRTPTGERERSPGMVREAAATLRDPSQRLRHELELKLSARIEPIFAGWCGCEPRCPDS